MSADLCKCAARTSWALASQSSVSQDRSDASRRASVVPCAGASAVLLRLYVTTMEETDHPERVSTQGHDRTGVRGTGKTESQSD